MAATQTTRSSGKRRAHCAQSPVHGELPVERLCAFLEQRLLISDLDDEVSSLIPHDLVGSNHTEDTSLLPSSSLAYQVIAANDKLIRPLLESLLPASALRPPGLDGHAGPLREMSPAKAYRLLLAYGASNNLAGLEHLVSPVMMFDYLKPIIQDLFHDKSLVSVQASQIYHVPSLKPLIETFFNCAIEKGDHLMVAGIIQSSTAGIGVNDYVVKINGSKYTAIERAAACQHFALTKQLIALGADVNHSHQDFNAPFRGALEQALIGSIPENVHQELARLLLRAGGEVSPSAATNLLRHDHLELALDIILCAGGNALRKLLLWGTIHEASHRFNDNNVLLVAARLHYFGLDLEHCHFEAHAPDVWTIARYPPTFLDIAAERAQVDVVKKLAGWGARCTQHTLTAAVRSQNQELIHFMVKFSRNKSNFARAIDIRMNNNGHKMQQASKSDHYSEHYRSTPFVEAFLARDPHLLAIFPIRADDEYETCVTIAAMAETGEDELLRACLQSPCTRIDANSLGYAMSKAVFANQTTTALTLLEAGASVDFEACGQVLGHRPQMTANRQHPLQIAVLNRNITLIRALLDYDVVDSLGSSSGSMRLAVEWGDLSIIRDLASAGVSSRDGLCQAIKDKKRSCIDTLLETVVAGRHNVNNAHGVYFAYEDFNFFDHDFDFANSPMREATEHGDAGMVQRLLSHGETIQENDLSHTIALGSPILQVLLTEFHRRYPRGKPGFGGYAMQTAVKTGCKDLVHCMLRCGFAHKLVSGHSPVGTCYSPLAMAIVKEYGPDAEMIRLFLEFGIDANRVVAMESDRLENDVWLEVDVLQNHRSQWVRRTSLLLAIRAKSTSVVQLLLDHKADVNLPATRGVQRTPLQEAAEGGSEQMVRLLLDRGADVKAPPGARYGGTPLQLAARGGYIGVAAILVKAGDDYLAAPSPVGGTTALVGASEHGRYDMVKYLTDLGEHTKAEYLKAIKIAQENGHHAVVDLLEKMVDVRCSTAIDDTPEIDVFASLATTGDKTWVFNWSNKNNPATEPEATEDELSSDSEDMDMEDLNTALVVNTAVDRRFACWQCEEILSNSSALRRHERTKHDDSRHFSCDICEKSFKRSDNLERHKKTHQGEQKHQCGNCGKYFSRRDTLSQHMKICEATIDMDMD